MYYTLLFLDYKNGVEVLVLANTSCFNIGIKMWYHPDLRQEEFFLTSHSNARLCPQQTRTEDKVLLKFRNLLDEVGIVSRLIPPRVQQHQQQMLALLQQIF